MNKEKCINEPLNNIYKIIHYKKNEKKLYLFCGKIEKKIENSIVNFIYKNNTSSDNDILIKKFGYKDLKCWSLVDLMLLESKSILGYEF